jgi:hypothetical protein
MVGIPILNHLIYLIVSIKAPVFFTLSPFALVRLWMSCCLWFNVEEQWAMRGKLLSVYISKNK